MSAIVIEHFSKNYHGNTVVSDLSLQVAEGEIFGFIGPNGAGKSTTIKALLDFIKPSTGTLAIFGMDTQKEAKAIRKVTTYVSSEVAFYPQFTTMELLQSVADFHKISQPTREIKRLIELFEMDAHKKVAELSLGNRKKIALACSLLPKPRLLILDEPTNGLDPLMQHRLFTELTMRNQQGMTIFLSSHQLAEIQEHAHRAAFIRQGKLLTIQPISTDHSLGKVVQIKTKTLQIVDFPSSFQILEHQDDVWRALYQGGKDELLLFLRQESILDFTIHTPTIEDQFMSLYEGGTIDDSFKN